MTHVANPINAKDKGYRAFNIGSDGGQEVLIYTFIYLQVKRSERWSADGFKSKDIFEIKDFSKTVDLNLPENFQIILDDKDNFHLNRFFYKQIGIDHYWRDRLLWSDSEWVKYVTNKNLETHVLKKGEDLVGYYEQEYHPGSNEVELINLGVLKEFRGLNLAQHL